MNELDEYFKSLVRPAIRELEPYDATMTCVPKIRLSANENNGGVPEPVLAAMRKALESGNRYPDSRNSALRSKIASRYGLAPENIITTNGLDGLFTMLGRAFLDPGDEVICGECTFSVYADNARIAGATVKKIPLGADGAQHPEDFAAAVTPATKMLFFCNPNNPTGTMASAVEVRAMLDAIPRHVIVILDEAYIDFSGENTKASFKLLADFPNLIITRTFSKMFALAGLRLGWGAAHPKLIDYLYIVREPYCVTTVAEAGASAALDETEYVEKTRHQVAADRAALCELLGSLGVKYTPSRANFVLVFPAEKFEPLAEAFASRGIAVRTMSLRGERMMRISIGVPEENREVERVIKAIFTGSAL